MSSILKEMVLFKRTNAKRVSLSSMASIPVIDEILEDKILKLPNGKIDYDSEGNPKTRLINRKIRYVPGESSIYADEQSEGVDEKKLTPIILEGHQLFVSRSEVLKLEYLMKSNYNSSKENRKPGKSAIYYTYDREADFKTQNEKKFDRIKAEGIVMDMDLSALKALLMISSDTYANVDSVSRMGRSEIIHDCLRIAKDNPKLVLKGLKTKSEKNKYLLLQAISQGFIVYKENVEELHWSGGKMLTHAPIGQNAIDYFVSLTLEDNADIDEIMDQIKRKVSYNIQTEKEEVEKTMEHLLLDKAIKAGVVKVTGNWHHYVNTDDKIDIKKQGAALFIKEIEEDEDLFFSIRLSIKKVHEDM